MIEYRTMSDEELSGLSPEVAQFRVDIEKVLNAFQSFEIATSIDLENFVGDFLRLLKSSVFSESKESSLLRIALAGNYSCGKSSFINDLVGANVAPIGSGETTRTITRIKYGQTLQFFDSEGDCISEKDYRNKAVDKDLNRLQYTITIPSDFLKGVILSDVPGFDPGTQSNAEEKIDNEISLKEDRNADIIFFLCRLSDGVPKQNVIDFLKGSKSSEGILNADYVGENKKKKLYVIITMADTEVDQERREAVKRSISINLKNNGIQHDDCFLYANLNDQNCEPLEDDEKVFFEKEKQKLKQKIEDIVKEHGGLAKKRLEDHLKKNKASFSNAKREILIEIKNRKESWKRKYLLENKISELIIENTSTELKDLFVNRFNHVYQMYESAINNLIFCEVNSSGTLFKNYYIDARDGRWDSQKNWLIEWKPEKNNIDAFMSRLDPLFRPYLRLPSSISEPKLELLDTYNKDFFGNNESKVRNECCSFNKTIRQKWLNNIKEKLAEKKQKFFEWVDGSAYTKENQLELNFNTYYSCIKSELE